MSKGANRFSRRVVDPGVAQMSPASFRELVEEHKQAVYRLAADLTGNRVTRAR